MIGARAKREVIGDVRVLVDGRRLVVEAGLSE
jgi:hypothetical protein